MNYASAFPETFSISEHCWTYEQQCAAAELEKSKQAETLRKHHFATTFPTVNYADLIRQKDDISTDDGCIHFKHKDTLQIYSWDYLENEWILDNGNDDLEDLFG